MPESYEHEVRVAGGSGQGQNLVFLSFQGHNIDFFDISRRSVYVLVRSLRSLARWWCCEFTKGDFGFFRILVFFSFFEYFLGHSSQFWLFIMQKDRFWPFYQILAFLVICGFLS